MADTNVVFSLAKVIIAAAWADGEVSLDEVNCMKDLLFRLPNLTERDWLILDMYIEAPVSEAERARLVAELQDALQSSQDKALAKRTLDELIHADGEVTAEEEAVLQEVSAAIDQADTGALGGLGRLMRGSINRRSESLSQAPNREIFFEDFVKNKVYYEVQRRERTGQVVLEISDGDLRKLSLAGGLMARVADVDHKVTSEEQQRIVSALEAGWDLGHQSAALVAEVAVAEVSKDLDYYRLSRSFFETTDERERLRFLDVLFSVAAADGYVSNDEMEEIRTISTSLKLTHKQFIDAKVKQPREIRAN